MGGNTLGEDKNQISPNRRGEVVYKELKIKLSLPERVHVPVDIKNTKSRAVSAPPVDLSCCFSNLTMYLFGCTTVELNSSGDRDTTAGFYHGEFDYLSVSSFFVLYPLSSSSLVFTSISLQIEIDQLTLNLNHN